MLIINTMPPYYTLTCSFVSFAAATNIVLCNFFACYWLSIYFSKKTIDVELFELFLVSDKLVTEKH